MAAADEASSAKKMGGDGVNSQKSNLARKEKDDDDVDKSGKKAKTTQGTKESG